MSHYAALLYECGHRKQTVTLGTGLRRLFPLFRRRKSLRPHRLLGLADLRPVRTPVTTITICNLACITVNPVLRYTVRFASP
jgi:hypothetical protein